MSLSWKTDWTPEESHAASQQALSTVEGILTYRGGLEKVGDEMIVSLQNSWMHAPNNPHAETMQRQQEGVHRLVQKLSHGTNKPREQSERIQQELIPRKNRLIDWAIPPGFLTDLSQAEKVRDNIRLRRDLLETKWPEIEGNWARLCIASYLIFYWLIDEVEGRLISENSRENLARFASALGVTSIDTAASVYFPAWPMMQKMRDVFRPRLERDREAIAKAADAHARLAILAEVLKERVEQATEADVEIKVFSDRLDREIEEFICKADHALQM